MRPPAIRVAVRLVLGLCVATGLASGVMGGLWRAGAWPASGSWLAPAASLHAFLMVCCFFGTVIGIERAVALKHPLAFTAPAASAAAGVAALLAVGGGAVAPALALLASLAFIATNAVVVRRQPAAHTGLLLASALAWAVGNAVFAFGGGLDAAIAWWFAFLVMTIAAERLELTRLTPRSPAARLALVLILGLLAVGAALIGVAGTLGHLLYGAALLALSMWLLRHDVARRTVRAPGLPRYMALCLLSGYFWMGLSGLAWAASATGLPLRDMALHALAVGFVFSMVFGHAPVILPAVAGVRMRFGPWFYGPLVLLHASLALRVLGALVEPAALAWGAAGNAAAVAGFVITAAGSALAWRAPARRPAG